MKIFEKIQNGSHCQNHRHEFKNFQCKYSLKLSTSVTNRTQFTLASGPF